MMKKWTLFLIIGLFLQAIPFVLKHILAINGDLPDFIQGVGTGFILGSLFLFYQNIRRRRSYE